MLDLSKLDQATLLARGQYATVRSAHEDQKKSLQVLCGGLSAISVQVLRAMQPDNDASADMAHVAALLANGRAAVDNIAACTERIASLAEQRAALKPVAWPK